MLCRAWTRPKWVRRFIKKTARQKKKKKKRKKEQKCGKKLYGEARERRLDQTNQG